MSICIARASSEGLVLASDTGSFMGDRVQESGFKWINISGWWIAQTGVGIVGQAIRFGIEEPIGEDISALIGWLRRAMTLHGVKSSSGSGPDDYNCRLIAARGKKIWDIDGYLYAIEISERKWATIGSGCEVAIGALEAFEVANVSWSDSDVARQSIGIVNENIHTTRGCEVRVIPYHTMEQKIVPMQQRRDSMTVDR